MTRARQDEVTRRRRLNAGRCPTHGTVLSQVGVAFKDGVAAGDRVACTRKDCGFEYDVVKNGSVWNAWRKKAGVR